VERRFAECRMQTERACEKGRALYGGALRTAPPSRRWCRGGFSVLAHTVRARVGPGMSGGPYTMPHAPRRSQLAQPQGQQTQVSDAAGRSFYSPTPSFAAAPDTAAQTVRPAHNSLEHDDSAS
jgi:hypothetical protein